VKNDSVNVTFKEFFLNCQSIADEYKKHSTYSDFIIIADNSYEYLETLFSIFLMGKRAILIEPQKSTQEIKRLVDLFEKAYVIVSSPIEGISHNYLIGHKKNKLSTKFDINRLPNLTQAELVTFTSGTTELPKGVVHSLDNLIQTSFAFSKKHQIQPENVFYHIFPMSYMAGVLNNFILPMVNSCKIVIGERFTVKQAINFWNYPISKGVTNFWFNPTMLSLIHKLSSSNAIKNSKVMRCGYVATAPLEPSLWECCETDFGFKLYNTYGLSETLFTTTTTDYTKGYDLVGEALDGVHIEFGSDDELLINCPWIAKGYLGTKDFFNDDDCFKSGDLGYIRENNIVINGRKKDLIIRGGLNINPVLIDKKLNQYLNIKTVTFGKLDEILGEKIIVTIETENSDIVLSDVNKVISEFLSLEYKADELVYVKEMPLNTNGKIDMRKLKELIK
jgi:long-chain acyl-CoA synthetase